jgi:uncharacterized protein YoxC
MTARDTQIDRGDALREAQRDAQREAQREAQRDAQRRAAQEEAVRAAAERAEAQREALRAEAQRAAEERAEALRAAQAAAERAAAQRAEAQRAATDRAAAERAAERAAAERAGAEAAAQRAGADAAAERAAMERAVAERAAAERAVAEAAAARAEAEAAIRRAEADAEAERAAAERAVAEADAHARRRPLLTVEAEDEEDDDDELHRGSRPTVTTQELILAGRSDSLQAALASIALRIDALTSTTSTFRNLVSDRITDYAEQVGRLATSAAGDLDDYRHVHERALEQIRRSVGEAEDNVRRLGRSVGDLDSKVGALVAAVRETGDAIDQISSERDQVSDTLVRSMERVEDALSEITEGKGATSFARLGDMIAALAGERDRQNAAFSQLEAVVVALADDREHGADVLVRLERAVNDMTVGRERGQAKALSRLEARLDEIASAMAGFSGEDVAGTLSRLDNRLKEMTTELVVGRDRETARALAQLSAQVDGIAGLVAEGRTDLSPIEARLNRMARSTTQAPPVDLAELYARLDELADVVAQHAGPDVSELQGWLDQLADRASPDPTWATAMQRLERLLPSLEGLRAGSGTGRGETAASIQDRRELLERFDQLGQQLSEQLEALRRRIALRGRPGGPGLDDAAIAAIADAVVARLSEGSSGRPLTLGPSSSPVLTRAVPPPPADTAPESPPRGRSQWRT